MHGLAGPSLSGVMRRQWLGFMCSFRCVGCMILSLGRYLFLPVFRYFMTEDCHGDIGDIGDSFHERFYGLLTEIASHKQLPRSYLRDTFVRLDSIWRSQLS